MDSMQMEYEVSKTRVIPVEIIRTEEKRKGANLLFKLDSGLAR